MMKRYRGSGDHPHDLTGGRIVAPGEYVELDEDAQKDPHNKSLMNEGKLVEYTDEKPRKTKKGGEE